MADPGVGGVLVGGDGADVDRAGQLEPRRGDLPAFGAQFGVNPPRIVELLEGPNEPPGEPSGGDVDRALTVIHVDVARIHLDVSARDVLRIRR